MTFTGRIPGKSGEHRIETANGRITSMVAVGPSGRGNTDAGQTWITPGLLDIQINGISGISFTDPDTEVDDLARADEAIRACGVSRYCPTIITRDHDTTTGLCSLLRRAWSENALPGALGIHLEGPFISSEDGYRGAHQRRFTRDPDFTELEEWQEAADGRVRIITLAPERTGSMEFIRKAVDAGILVALGHTNASEQDVRRAADAGAKLSTHLFNGCSPLVNRHRNPIFAQLSEDRLWASFIADGHHIPLSTLQIALRAKGAERSILVSDIVQLAGLPDGDYEMEEERIRKADGGIWRVGEQILSGAARTLDQDIELLARRAEPGLETAFRMATRNPAELLGMGSAFEIKPRQPANLAVWRWCTDTLTLERRVGF
jgi:N-acetylglucosamine-6-phosphate deacetylase